MKDLMTHSPVHCLQHLVETKASVVSSKHPTYWDMALLLEDCLVPHQEYLLVQLREQGMYHKVHIIHLFLFFFFVVLGFELRT
jgi:hypothetical protein